MRVRLRGRTLDLERGRPLIMGILNAGPDSFSDPGERPDAAALADRGTALAEQGAQIVDVGGQSGRTDRPAVSEDEEARRIAPVVERLAGSGLDVSVDTWRPGPARAALEAGASMVNDVSGLADPALADLCAQHGAALVITHTTVAPKRKTFPRYGDVVADVGAFLEARGEEALARGVPREAQVLDPGLDLAKTPAQSLEILQRLPELASLGRPLLLAISRKDFVGALTGREPSARDAGTLGAIEPALECDATILRVHDAAGARDFLAVRAALRGEAPAPGPLETGLRTEALA